MSKKKDLNRREFLKAAGATGICAACAPLTTLIPSPASAFSLNGKSIFYLMFRQPLDMLQVCAPNDQVWMQSQRQAIAQEMDQFTGSTSQSGFLTRLWENRFQDIRNRIEGNTAMPGALVQKVGYYNTNISSKVNRTKWGSGVDSSSHAQYGNGWAARLAEVNSGDFTRTRDAWLIGTNSHPVFDGGTSYAPARIHDLNNAGSYQQQVGNDTDIRRDTLFTSQQYHGLKSTPAQNIQRESIAALETIEETRNDTRPGGYDNNSEFGRILATFEYILTNHPSFVKVAIGEDQRSFRTFVDQRNYYQNNLQNLNNNINTFLNFVEGAGLQNNVILVVGSYNGRNNIGSGLIDSVDPDVGDYRGTDEAGGPGDVLVFASNARPGVFGTGYTSNEIRTTNFSAPSGSWVELNYLLVAQLGYSSPFDMTGLNTNQFNGLFL